MREPLDISAQEIEKLDSLGIAVARVYGSKYYPEASLQIQKRDDMPLFESDEQAKIFCAKAVVLLDEVHQNWDTLRGQFREGTRSEQEEARIRLDLKLRIKNLLKEI